MRGAAGRDVLKVWVYAVAAILLGAWATPLFYNAGKALAEVSSVKTTNGPLEWLADLCRTADLSRFFMAALLLAAAALFLPFIEWLGGGHNGGQRLAKNPRFALQATAGFLAAGTACAVLAGVLQAAGVYHWRLPAPAMAGEILRVLLLAVALGTLAEVFFRGMALGVFLRALPVPLAVLLAAALSAGVSVLHPLADVRVADPDAGGVGLELLGKIGAQFADPWRAAGALLPPFALGALLGWARWRTASLALPVGFHCGWLFASMVLGRLAASPDVPGSRLWMLSSTDLDHGLFPLIGIVVAGGLVTRFTRMSHGRAEDAA